MSDLRKWLKDASLTEIEAELQKRDKEIERLEWVKNDHWVKVQNWSDRAVKAETALPEANKLLEQTIEVLERSAATFNLYMKARRYEADIAADQLLDDIPPLLDNLKAREKEGTE